MHQNLPYTVIIISRVTKVAVKLLSKLEKNVAVIAIFYTDHSYTPLAWLYLVYQPTFRCLTSNGDSFTVHFRFA